MSEEINNEAIIVAETVSEAVIAYRKKITSEGSDFIGVETLDKLTIDFQRILMEH